MAQYVALRHARGGGRVRVPGTIYLTAPANPAVTAVASGGTFAAATYYWKIVAVNGSGVSVGSSEVSAAIVLNGSANLSWSPVTGATSYRIYRGTATNSEDHYQTSSTTSFTDTGATGTSGTVPGTATGFYSSLVQLSSTVDTIVDLDQAAVRAALGHHNAVGQYYVTAANHSYGAAGSKSNLTANS